MEKSPRDTEALLMPTDYPQASWDGWGSTKKCFRSLSATSLCLTTHADGHAETSKVLYLQIIYIVFEVIQRLQILLEIRKINVMHLHYWNLK